MSYWATNLPAHMTHLPAALGLGEPSSSPSKHAMAVAEAASALVALTNGIGFLEVSCAGRPGLWETREGVRIDVPSGADGVQLALASMVASQRAGALCADVVDFVGAVANAMRMVTGDDTPRPLPPSVDEYLRTQVRAIEALLDARQDALARLAAALEASPNGRLTHAEAKSIVEAN